MAKLAAYNADTPSLAIGSVPNTPTLDGVGNGLQQLSSGLNKISAYMVQDQKAEEQRMLAEAKADQAMLVHSDVENFKTWASDTIAKNAEGAGIEGFGITETSRKNMEDEMKRRIAERFPLGAQDPKIIGPYLNTIEAYTRQAQNVEGEIRRKWRAETIGKQVDNLSTTLAAAPDTYGVVEGEWNKFIDESVHTSSPKAKEDLRADGLARLQRAALEGVKARNNGKDLVDAFNGIVVNTPNVANLHPAVKDSMTAATNAGYMPERIVAFGKLESNLNPNMGSMAGTSTPSSATGMFQVLAGNSRNAVATRAALGVTQQDVLTNNYAKIADGLSRHVLREQEKLKAAGLTPTAGSDYMIWNIGPAATKALLTANPNEEVSSVLRRVWGPHMGPGELEQSLRNNPGMYKAGQTVGQVVANYERKMAGATAATAGMVTGQSMTTDAQAQAVLATVMPPGSFSKLTAADIAKPYAEAVALQKQVAKAQQLDNLGQSLLSGDIPARAYDPEHKKAIDAQFAPHAQTIHQGITSGDPAVLANTRAIAERVSVIPDAHMHALRETILGGGPEAKAQSYKMLSDLATDRRVAYDASQVDQETAARVKEFRAYTSFLNMKPGQAIQRIEMFRQGDGKQTKQLMAEQLEGAKGKPGELDRISWSTVSKAFDDGIFSSAPTAVNDVQKAAAVEAVKRSYEFHRLSGQDADASQALALDELRQGWGVSRALGNKNLMPHPPEKYYGEINGSMDWVQREARDRVTNYLTETGRVKQEVDPNTGALIPLDAQVANIELRVISDGRTSAEAQSGRIPTYMLAFRNKDGRTEILPERFDLGFAYQNATFDATLEAAGKALTIRQNQQLNDEANSRVIQRTPGATPLP